MRSVVLLLFSFAFFFTGNCIAQDTVKQGVIKVRRAPVQAAYKVKLNYEYKLVNQGFFGRLFYTRRAREYGFDPPQPVTVAHRGDSINTAKDSASMPDYLERNDRSKAPFNWEEWLGPCEYYMDWDDTASLDSATFIYTVNTNGFVRFEAVTQKGSDSSSIALQKKLTPYMRRLWVWFPASSIEADSGRRKYISCTVIVKVYAKPRSNKDLPPEDPD